MLIDCVAVVGGALRRRILNARHIVDAHETTTTLTGPDKVEDNWPVVAVHQSNKRTVFVDATLDEFRSGWKHALGSEASNCTSLSRRGEVDV